MISYGQKEFSDLMKSPSEEFMKQVHPFLLDDEVIFKTFTNDETVAFFTNQRILFVRIPSEAYPLIFKDWTIAPYSKIIFLDILTTDTITYGKMELRFDDNNVINFYIDKFDDAIKLSKTISRFMNVK